MPCWLDYEVSIGPRKGMAGKRVWTRSVRPLPRNRHDHPAGSGSIFGCTVLWQQQRSGGVSRKQRKNNNTADRR